MTTRVRQERAEVTRQAILDGAAAAFDRLGYGSASLTDIAQQAGVTKGALYFHFKSKESLAQALVQEQFAAVNPAGAAEQLGVQNVIDRSHYLGRALCREVRVRAGVRLVLERGLLDGGDPSPYEEWIEQSRVSLAFGQGRGDVRPEVDAYDVATYLVGAFTGIQITSDVRTRRADLSDRVTDMWRFLLPAIVPPRRLGRFDPAGSQELESWG
ncbi:MULTISPECIES: ScbR family autoregulator-binding transcription factor [unclassified Streptomyces]|uniref:ScbR family autoregulator-binding transcription factor n=1 Tax=Streptomyces TaxID=1883 RepID=UPI0001C19D8D|nr:MULTISPECIES: ScbR family autoregulator-binding transcription factor [unclassified Streptomyces]AEN14094.1 transcriptional regulator, TetR family [Streptomyces sp. SirexAA-E]MYR67681.1 TetR family transcriptional regulator [Streptomyces sp. SID4939]MYS02469.1 TetR family transcriptional regulator [Streptomyces sp. SID4940]MYT67982.1 TetR family transcriptional regulator [Streptomyces sp. SID8357]MYT86825.1 TetR family transcriptional regulator [Streptomyces sp. SID8360]